MNRMSNKNFKNDGLNSSGPVGEDSSSSRCFLVQQCGSCHPTTFRTKWFKKV